MRLIKLTLAFFFIFITLLLVISIQAKADEHFLMEYVDDEWTGGAVDLYYDSANQHLIRVDSSTIYGYTVDKVSKAVTLQDSLAPGATIKSMDYDGTYYHVFAST